MASFGPGDFGERYEYLIVYMEGEHFTYIPSNPLQVAVANQSLSELVISLCNTGWHLVKFVSAKSMVVFRRPKLMGG